MKFLWDPSIAKPTPSLLHLYISFPPENLEAGATVGDFLKWYEGVTREQVLEVLKHAERSLAAA